MFQEIQRIKQPHDVYIDRCIFASGTMHQYNIVSVEFENPIVFKIIKYAI